MAVSHLNHTLHTVFNEKKSPVIYPLRFTALDSLAANALFNIFIICRVGPDAGCC